MSLHADMVAFPLVTSLEEAPTASEKHVKKRPGRPLYNHGQRGYSNGEKGEKISELLGCLI